MFLSISVLAAGCSQQQLPDRAQRITHGYIFYLDGAGGGGAIRNYTAGVKQGMLDAGYDGAGEVFAWQTGLGMLADQESSLEYKRAKAAECAKRIVRYARANPGAPITVMGMSAGTAVAVFALEALPDACSIDNAVLLSASLSADYDLTRALRHVRGRVYVTTSDRDSMLAYLVPLAGTADRRPGTVPSAGLRGFDPPLHARPEEDDQYAKLMYLRWNPEFIRLGDEGRHFGTVSPRFIQVCIAPLIMRGCPTAATQAGESAHSATQIVNPDYERWSRFPLGSWVAMRGQQSVANKRQDICMQATLIANQPEMLIVERRYFLESDGPGKPIRIQGFFVPARIRPEEHPLSSATAKVSQLPEETVAIQGRTLTCLVRNVQATGSFPDYGRDVAATFCENETLPGGIGRIWLRSNKSEGAFEFRGDVVDYDAR